MEVFFDFVEKNFKDFKLVNITKKINSRNIANFANIINENPENIYFIEKRPLNVNIFRNMNYPTHRYMFLNREKVFVLEDTNIEPHILRFAEFLQVEPSKKKNKKKKNKKKKNKDDSEVQNNDEKTINLDSNIEEDEVKEGDNEIIIDATEDNKSKTEQDDRESEIIEEIVEDDNECTKDESEPSQCGCCNNE